MNRIREFFESNRGVLITAAVFLFGLLLLSNAPGFWERWQAGWTAIPIMPLVLGLAVVVGVLAFYLGRRQWFSVWVWRGWVAGVLATPLFMAVLDTALVYVIQPLALLLLVGCSVHFLVKGGGQGITKAAALLLIPFAILVVLSPSPPPDVSKWIGPCHLFSDLRNKGCVRSFPLSYSVPVFIHMDPNTGKEQLIRAYGAAVWIEPLNRWEALVNFRGIRTDEGIRFLSLKQEETELEAYNTYWSSYPPPQIGYTRIDLQSGDVIGPIRLNETYTEAVLEYVKETGAYLWRTDKPPDPNIWAEGQIVSLAKTEYLSGLSLVDTATGDSAATVLLGAHDPRYADFSPDGRYLVVTTFRQYGHQGEYWGLIFEVETLLQQSGRGTE